MVQARLKYADDTDDDETPIEPVKRKPFDARVLARASGYLQSSFDEAQEAARYSERFNKNMAAYQAGYR